MNDLFPRDEIEALPAWVFDLHFTAPDRANDQMLRQATQALRSVPWRIVRFPSGLDGLLLDGSANSVWLRVAAADDRRRCPQSVDDLRSDLDQLVQAMADCGFFDVSWEAPPSGQKSRFTEQSTRRVHVLLSIGFYAILMLVNLDPKVQAKFTEAFGRRPLGLPVMFVVVVTQSLLYLPMPWIFLHALRIAFQALEDGRRFGLSYLLTVGNRHPQLRQSQRICLGGLLYFLILCAAWILYAAALGI